MKWYSILLFFTSFTLLWLTTQPFATYSIYNSGQNGMPYVDQSGFEYTLSEVPYYWLPILVIGLASLFLFFFNNIYTAVVSFFLSFGLFFVYYFVMVNFENYVALIQGAYDPKMTNIYFVFTLIVCGLILVSLVNVIIEAMRTLKRLGNKKSVQPVDVDLLEE